MSNLFDIRLLSNNGTVSSETAPLGSSAGNMYVFNTTSGDINTRAESYRVVFSAFGSWLSILMAGVAFVAVSHCLYMRRMRRGGGMTGSEEERSERENDDEESQNRTMQKQEILALLLEHTLELKESNFLSLVDEEDSPSNSLPLPTGEEQAGNASERLREDDQLDGNGQDEKEKQSASCDSSDQSTLVDEEGSSSLAGSFDVDYTNDNKVLMLPPPGMSAKEAEQWDTLSCKASTCTETIEAEDAKGKETKREDPIIVRRFRPVVPAECSICLEPYRVGERVTWSQNTLCQHVFHEDHIVQWLTKRSRARGGRNKTTGTTCPCCRHRFVLDLSTSDDAEKTDATHSTSISTLAMSSATFDAEASAATVGSWATPIEARASDTNSL